ncbi:DUF2155 domain-containing protein [Methyloceanibacter sp.]|uniref:DUF2155 domain-containing protein n=1 Tax=Methyloceanibacter sp. TaxID=1965321 RepID=UPI00351AF4C0
MAEACLPRKRAGAIVETDQTVCGRMEHGKAFAASRIGLALFLVSFALCVAWTPAAAAADTKIKNKVAVFAALDKVTGRISHLEIPIDKTVEFGALKVTPRVCDTRPPTEQPNTASFVEVDEVKLTGEEQRLFTGWMFAESPGLHAVEHPVFDVWLTSCKMPEGGQTAGNAANAAVPGATPAPDAAAADAAAPPPAAEPEPEPPAEAAEAPAPAEEPVAPLPWAR